MKSGIAVYLALRTLLDFDERRGHRRRWTDVSASTRFLHRG
jgi:hypothetical protein